MQDQALPPALVDGLEEYVSRMVLERVPDATHWIIHERPQFVAQRLQAFLAQPA
jgi:pimeloyl-ACP methyl ester carboxylesterase